MQPPSPAKDSRICRHFINGSCTRANCAFSHDASSQPCRFLSSESGCSKGATCPFSHSTAPAAAPPSGVSAGSPGSHAKATTRPSSPESGKEATHITYRVLSEDEWNALQSALKREDGPAGDTKEIAQIRAQLRAFAESKEKSMDFPSSLTPTQRKAVHDIAEEMRFEHVSSGKGDNRYVCVKKIAAEEGPERYVTRGYIGLAGLYVDYEARTWARKVKIPPSYASRRESRDGASYHITIITKPEISALLSGSVTPPSATAEGTSVSPAPSWTMYGIQKKVYGIADDWTALGVGKVVDGDNEAFFVVLDWKSANEVRKSMGLPPKDFHITIGFKEKDIHEPARKGPESLISSP